MYKEKYKTGQIYISETHPQYDFMIDYVTYYRVADSAYDFNLFSIVCWQRINMDAFYKFVCEKKGYDVTFEEFYAINDGKRVNYNTFPYALYGEGKPKSIDAMVRKYNMRLIEQSDDNIMIFKDNEFEFSSGFERRIDSLKEYRS